MSVKNGYMILSKYLYQQEYYSKEESIDSSPSSPSTINLI